MLAALWLEVSEWAHARLLRPALQPVLVGHQAYLLLHALRLGVHECNLPMRMDELFSGQAVWPAKPLSLPALLPAYSAAQVQLGQLVSGGVDPIDRDEDERRLIRRKRLVGQPAVFKLFAIRGPADVLVAAKEVQLC
jgi:hypothetical protein